MEKFNYIGVFFSKETDNILRKRGNKFSRPTKNLHVTVKYRPEDVPVELFGSEVAVQITGYGYSNENEGLSCKLVSENSALQKLLDAIEVPHITLSISEDGRAVNTRYVDFSEPLSFVCKGRFGGFRKGEVIL